jgi:hypothetical protein
MKPVARLLLPTPSAQVTTRPSPWRMAEREEREHALENRRREQALRCAGSRPRKA